MCNAGSQRVVTRLRHLLSLILLCQMTLQVQEDASAYPLVCAIYGLLITLRKGEQLA